MKNIEGIVCVAELNGRRRIIFGKGITPNYGCYKEFSTNGLTPFRNKLEAEFAKLLMTRRKDIKSISFAQIKMNLAEHREEFIMLQEEDRLVVVKKRKTKSNNLILIGAVTSDSPTRSPFLGQLLDSNGLKPFSSFTAAEQVMNEEKRRSRCLVYISSFELDNI